MTLVLTPDKFKSVTFRDAKGFTIVELLVVIVVIAILAAVTIVAYNGVQQRARDSARANNVQSIKSALEIYYADNNAYPAVCAGGDNAGCAISSLSTALVPTYISTIPADPNGSTMSYVRGTAASSSYAIYISYEARAVCKTGVNVNTGWWGTGVPTC